MLKYADTAVVFEEVPNKVTLAIDISGCPCRCPLCHSKHLWGDIGSELTEEALEGLLEAKKGINCVAFMGGDNDPAAINALAAYVKNHHDGIAVAWYSGREAISTSITLDNFDYIKIGPYIEEAGPLNSETTNQRFFEVVDGCLNDVTDKFWKLRE